MTTKISSGSLAFPLSRFPAFFLCGALLAALVPFHTVRAADPLIETFQKALFEEEANQNYDAAIRAYIEVVGKLDDQRKLAATALFRLAECYRKIGRSNDAVVAYQRVMRDFPDQAKLVDLSRTSLSTVAPAPSGSDRVPSLEREIAEEESRSAPIETFVTQLKKSPRADWAKEIAKAVPDALLARMLENQKAYKEKLTELAQRFTEDHPDFKAANALTTTIEKQIGERVDGLLVGMETRLSASNARLDVLRQQLMEAKRASFPAQRVAVPAPNLPPADRAKLKALLQQELDIAEGFFAQQKERVRVGAQAPGEEARFERDVLGLRRQLLAVDGLAKPEVREQWQALLREEISLAEKAAQLEKVKLENGRAVPGEVARLQRDVLALKRELITFEATPASPSSEAAQPAFSTRLQGVVSRADDSAVSDEEEKEIRRIRSLIQDSPDLINARNNVGAAPLHTASGAGYARVVRFLLESGADPNLKGGAQNSGLTALHAAARSGHKSVVDLLIEAKADATARDGGGNTPLHQAAQNGYRLIVDRLLGAGVPVNSRNNVGMTPLHYAVAFGHQSVVELLFKKGADLNLPATSRQQPAYGPEIQEGYAPVHTAVTADQIALVRWLNTNGANINASGGQKGVTPLHVAAQMNSTDAIRALIRPGLDLDAPDAFEQTPLFYAIMAGRLNAAEVLLDAGANPNGRSGSSSPLLHMVRESEELLRLLIAHKANLEVTNKSGRTLLFTTIENVANCTNLVSILLEAGANANAALANGYGPLHAAATRANPEAASQLLRHGADVNALTSDGATPLFYARTSSHNWRTSEHVAQIITLLLANGADETLQRRRSISVIRRARGYEASVFSKGTNDFNRHSLFELLAVFYSGGIGSASGFGNGLPFPDLEHVIVNRALGGGRTVETNINVEARMTALGCQGDFWLEWGDVVEILELDHPLPANWAGFKEDFARSLGDCVSRKFSIVIKGRTNVYALKPSYSSSPYTLLNVPSFRLREVLRNSQLLLTSSDSTRVTVNRRDPITSEPRQWTLDTSLPLGANDLWLRDGDVIEVPDLPPGVRLPVDSDAGRPGIAPRLLRPRD